jgi:integrase
VPEAFVDAVLPHVSRQVAAMIELQRLTGMRSGEVTILRGCDLDTSGKVWIFTPHDHKTAHHGHERKVYLGPKAQLVIRPFLKADSQAYLFSPKDAVAEQLEAKHASRKTPLSCGNRPGTNRKSKPKREPGERYDTNSYRRAIDRGIAAANKAILAEAAAEGIAEKDAALIPHWHPHQLRHNAATNLRKEHGIEVARIILGHRSAAITEVYAEVDHARAIDVMGKVG